LYVDEQHPDSLGVDPLSIALVGPDEDRRKAAAIVLAEYKGSEIHEFSFYPPSLEDVPKFLEQHYDVIIIDLDAQPEYALQLVENMCVNGTATVMVYSVKTDSELLVRCMRAGAREFLTFPFTQDTVAKALIRASTRRPGSHMPKKASGRLLAFLGAKGGDGVTTLACNFAVSLAQESDENTLLIDLDLPLGDAALNLGVSAEYSTINALQNASRLDSSFLSKLLVKHGSGVSVLAAPGKFPQFDASIEAIDKLIAVARQDFDNVVIDMGSRLDLTGTSIFKDGSTIYLVIQAGIAGLRNSNRVISQYFSTGVPKLEIVLNRFQQRSMGVAEDQIAKALTRPAQWKIPNDFAAVRRMQHTAVPLALEDSPISRVIRQMARSACGLPPIQEKEKKTGFSFKNISRNLTAKISSSGEASSISKLGLATDTDNAVDAPGEAQAEAMASNPENSTAPSPSGAVLLAEAPAPLMLTDTAEGSSDLADSEGEAKPEGSYPNQQEEPETRTFRGATYLKGADGEWHLRQAEAKAAEKAPERETPVIAWSTPDSIVFGTPLSPLQLNALASVLGAFAYKPALGEILAAGTHELAVVFTPADDAAYRTAEAKVLLTITKATPAVMWPAPAPVIYGTPLSAAQLNATASIPGTFVYTPAAGEALTAGTQTLSATFTPADSTDYDTVYAIVPLTVTKAESAITWPKPASIAYGTALGAAQLNATASIPGTFVYTPAAREVLTAGLQTLSVTFTPSDSTDFNKAKATVPLVVTRATPIITWPAPEAISYGTALSTSQLNASALVPGSFLYSPAVGEVLEAGTHALSVSFTPADLAAYTTVQAAVPLTVTEARPATISTSASHDAALSAGIQSSSQPQPAPPETSPAEAEKAPVQARPVSTKTEATVAPKPPVNAPQKPSAKAPVKPPVKSAHKPSAKVQMNPPAESAAELPATPPVETPAKSLVRVLGPKSVIDVGPGLDLMGSAVFQDGTTIYLVMQPGSGGQQDSSQMVSQFFASGGPKPEIMINRIEPRTQGVAPGQTSTALARMAYSPISRLIGQMARPVSDAPATPEKGTGFSFRGLGRKFWAKISSNEKAQSMTQLGLADGGDHEGTSAREAQPGVVANFPRRSVYADPAAPVFAAGMPIPHMPVDTAGRTDFIGGKLGRQSAGASSLHGGPETRTYKGANYVKGEDGQWHLQKSQNSLREMKMEAQATAHFYEPAPKAEAAPEKVPAKASAKRMTKAAAKPAAKVPGKRVTKAAAKPAAKASGKRVTKAAAKPAGKASAKKVVKPAAKSTTKTAAKRKAKPAVKAPVKASGKRVVKPAAKPAAKASARRVVKVKTAAAKPSAKSPAQKKPASTKKKPVPASSPKPAKTAKLTRPVVNAPSGGAVAESAVSKLTPEPAVLKPDSEISVNMPVSEFPQES
jgi:pilus assembly protein CpaE